jgi:large subunit ribosomal protein L10
LAISREQKEKRVEQFTASFSGAKAIVFTDFRGLKMGELNELRRRLRAIGATFHVTKNTLAVKAMGKLGQSAPEGFLTGPTGVVFLGDEISGGIKVLADYARETKILTLKGGLVGGQAVSAEQLEPLANLPPREVLLARLVGQMQAPLSRLVTVLNGPMRNLVYVLQARKEQLEKAAA